MVVTAQREFKGMVFFLCTMVTSVGIHTIFSVSVVSSLHSVKIHSTLKMVCFHVQSAFLYELI